VYLEIEDGDDENIEHEDDFLEKLKGKVPDHEMSGDGLGEDGEDDDDDDDGSDFDIDETDLESYSTVLEVNEDIDEFQIFCESLQSMLIFIDKFHFPYQLSYYRTSSRYNRLQSSIATKCLS